MDKLGRLEVEQLKVTSTTPPADSGLYKIDETTMGVVGDLKFRHPKTGAMSSALTVTTTSAQGVASAIVGGSPAGDALRGALASQYSHFPYSSGVNIKPMNFNPGRRFSIAVCGDSISLGAWSSLTAAQWPYLGYVGQLKTDLLALGYVDGGEGYISPLRTDAWVKTGTWATVAGESFSDTCYSATGTANYWTLTTPSQCDSFDIWFIDGAGAGDFEVVVDGGAPITVVTPKLANSARIAKTVALGAVGTHTVVVKAPTSGTLYFLGGAIYKGTSGLVIHNFSKSGESAVGFASSSSNKFLVFGLINPRVTIMSLLANDYGAAATTLETYASRMDQICMRIKQYGSELVGLVPPDNGLSPVGKPPLSQYESALKTAVTNYSGLTINVHSAWGDYASAAALMYDTQHPNFEGHTSIKNLLLDFCKSIGA